MKNKTLPNQPVRVQRLSFPEAEKVQAWLAMLLDAYYTTDKGVAQGILLMEQKGNRLACAKGCCSCCTTHRSIPAYPLELVGISWYATEKVFGPPRDELRRRLANHEAGDACAFLVDGICSIHAMRPMACRQFNVFNQVCAEGEDAYYTRRHDVLTPIKKYTEEAFYIMLPFYGVKNKAERRKIVKKGLIHAVAQDMQALNWGSLAAKMTEFDIRNR